MGSLFRLVCDKKCLVCLGAYSRDVNLMSGNNVGNARLKLGRAVRHNRELLSLLQARGQLRIHVLGKRSHVRLDDLQRV